MIYLLRVSNRGFEVFRSPVAPENGQALCAETGHNGQVRV